MNNSDENGDIDPVRGYEGEEALDQIAMRKYSLEVMRMREFMSNGDFITEKGDAKTNIINNTGGSYYLPDVDMEEFFKRLEACRVHGRTMNYAERQETADIEYSGIMIDLDIFQKTRNRIVNDRHLQRTVGRIATILRETLAFEADEQYFEFYVFVISKPDVKAVKDRVYKDGYHFLIPEIRVRRAYKRYLIEEINKKEVFANVFRDISKDLIDVNTILDKGSAYVPVNFVGSAKAGSVAYPLTHAFHVQIELDDPSMTNVQSCDVSCIKDGKNPDGDCINVVYELSLGFYFVEFDEEPTWLQKREYDYSMAIEERVQHFAEKRQNGIIDEDELADNDNDVDILTISNGEARHVKQLLGILDQSYATEYDKWFKVICSIANTSIRFKALAIWFSHRNPNAWSPAEIERVWGEATVVRAGREPVTKRSLMFWAAKCSPERYAEIDRENYNTILARSVYSNDGKIEHADAAKIIHSMVGDKFACDVPRGDKEGKHRVWYEFVLAGQKHVPGEIYKWRREDDPDILYNFIADQLPKVYDDQLMRLEEHKADAKDIPEQKYWMNVIKQLKKSKTDLGNHTYQTKVILQCQKRFRVRGFTTELDSYPNILGVGNGVLMLGTKPRLIQGFHEYKISSFTKVPYRPFNPRDPITKELLSIVADIIPEEDAREWIMFDLSTALDKNEVSGIMLQLKGGGRNGKTWILRMTHETLGDDNVVSFRPELLVGPNEKANEANSAKMQLMNKTLGYSDEFKATDVFNSTRVKTVNNPNRQGGREIYGRETNFKNTANVIIATNHDIGATDTDYGYWRRNAYYEAKVRFTEKPDPRNPYEKKVNDNIMDVYTNDPIYQEAWLSILVHYHTRLQSEFGGNLKRVPKPTIDRETEMYRDRQDTLNRFINKMVVYSRDADPIVIEKLAVAYIDWYGRYVDRGTKFKVDTVASLIESSKLHESIKNSAGNDVKVLHNHRLLESVDEPLQDGESYLNVPRAGIVIADGAEEDDSTADCEDANSTPDAADSDTTDSDTTDSDTTDSDDDDDSSELQEYDIDSDDDITDDDNNIDMEQVRGAALARVLPKELINDANVDFSFIEMAERNTPLRVQRNKEKFAKERKDAIQRAVERRETRETLMKGGLTREEIISAGY